MTTEIENLNRIEKESEAQCRTLKERWKHHAERDETYEAIKAKQALGLEQYKLTAVRERKRQLTTVDQNSTYRGAVFSGSNF